MQTSHGTSKFVCCMPVAAEVYELIATMIIGLSYALYTIYGNSNLKMV